MQYILDYINENEYKKLERSLKKYNMFAFKKLAFEYYPSLRDGKFLGEIVSSNEDKVEYELNLPADKIFEKVHGKLKLYYVVDKNKNVVILDKITPEEILMEGHRSELTTYKGVMISKENKDKDMFKINLLNMLNNNNK